MNDESYEWLNNQGDQIHWYCKKCNGSVAKIFSKLAQIELKQKETDKKVDQINSKVDQLKVSVDKNTKSVVEVENNVESVVDYKIEQLQKEQSDRERRRRNLIIHGVEESLDEDSTVRKEQDRECVDNLFRELNFEDVVIDKMGRLGDPTKTDENNGDVKKSRPLRVQLKNVEQKEAILKVAPSLKQKNSKWRKFYIKPDLTVQERKLKKELWSRREKGETDWVIRNGHLVKKTVTPAKPP